MSYPIEVRLVPKSGYHTPDEARRFYGEYDRNGIVVHWWDAPNKVKDSDHDNIVNYIMGKAQKQIGSIHYVVSNKKITKMCEAKNVSWHVARKYAPFPNASKPGIEFSPHLNDEGYKRGGFVINQLEKELGRSLPLSKHSDWVGTQCPGHLDLNRLRAEANKWKSGQYNTKGQLKVAEKTIYKPNKADIDKAWAELYGTKPSQRNYDHYTQRDISWLWHDFAYSLKKQLDAKAKVEQQKDVYITALQNDLETMRSQADELAKRPTKAALDELHHNLTVCAEGAAKQVEHIKELEGELEKERQAEHEPAEQGTLINRILNGIRILLPLSIVNKVLGKIKK